MHPVVVPHAAAADQKELFSNPQVLPGMPLLDAVAAHDNHP
jgi:hypothetical protein